MALSLREMRILNPAKTKNAPVHRRVPNDGPEISVIKIGDARYIFDENSLAVAQLEEGEDPKSIPESTDFKVPYKPFFQPFLVATAQYIVFQACHACNLRCKYCFVPDDATADIMSFETARAAVDRLINPKLDDWSVGFFGGEPLLNWDLIEQTVLYCEGRLFPKRAKFHVTTNGTLVTAKRADYLKRHNFSLIVSIDGPAHVHNSCRRFANGKDSHDATMQGLNHLRDAGLGPRITLRATYTPETVKHIYESIVYLNQLVEQGYAGWVSLEPAFLSELQCIDRTKMKESVSSADLSEVEEQYKRVVDWYVQEVKAGKKPLFHNVTKTIERLLWRTPYGTECGAGSGYLSVNAKGGIYACHREANTRIGNLYTVGIDEGLRAKWRDNRIYLRERCLLCPIRYVCGGGCREESLNDSGDIRRAYQPACAMRTIFFKTAVRIMSEVDSEALAQIVPPPKGVEGSGQGNGQGCKCATLPDNVKPLHGEVIENVEAPRDISSS